MRAWEPIEISINKIDVDDIITTSYYAGGSPLVGGGDDSGSEDIMAGVKDGN